VSLVDTKFGGDYYAVFLYYSVPQSQPPIVNESGVVKALTDADISWGFLRAAIAETAIKKLDTNGDGFIEWTEIEAALALLPK
jgi:hypothetical protein